MGIPNPQVARSSRARGTILSEPTVLAIKRGWINRTVLGVGLASLFCDLSHETATAILPAFLASLGASTAALGAIEGVADAVSSFLPPNPLRRKWG